MDRFDSLSYLKIDIASSFGLDKSSWQDRISWFDKHEHNLLSKLKEAKEPALFYAGVKAYHATLEGKPTGYMISLDATSSGLQLLAALTGDLFAAKLCNVINTGNREDAYTNVYQMMLDQIGDTAKIDRDDVKQSIMTAFYSSRAVPKQVFGEGKLLDIFYKTLEQAAPAAWELNEAMLALWDSNALSNDWVLPDNFHVHIKIMDQVKETVHFLNEPFDIFTKVNRPIEQGRSLGANLVHSIDGMIVREITRRCDYDKNQVEYVRSLLGSNLRNYSTKTNDDKLVVTLWDHYNRSGFLSARILQHLNADNMGHVDPAIIRDLIESLPKKPFKVISIHDCFRCHPNYGNDLREQYNRQLMLIAKSNLLQYVISQLVGHSVQISKLNPNLWKEVMQTNYALS